MKVRSKAPLRLGLAGGGTDVSPYCDDFGGYVLNATIDMYAYCTIERIENKDKVIFEALDRNELEEVALEEVISYNGILDLHKGVYNRVVKLIGFNKICSVKVTTYSDAPAGSGLGSSSTLVVAILKAFSEFYNIPLGEYDLAQLAYEIERVDIGLSGGRQDQYAAAFGGFNFMEFYKKERVIVNPLRIKENILDELEASTVLFYTGRSRESAGIIEEQKKHFTDKINSTIEASHKIKEGALLMKEALLKGKLDEFSRLLGLSWKEKKKLAKSITNSSIDKVYEAAMQNGALSGKISGAGGGGFMMFFVDPINKVRLVNALNSFEGNVINFHFNQNPCKSWIVN